MFGASHFRTFLRPKRHVAQQGELTQAGAVLEVATGRRSALARLEPVGVVPLDARQRLGRSLVLPVQLERQAGEAFRTIPRW